jgi:hypothetical protein
LFSGFPAFVRFVLYMVKTGFFPTDFRFHG